MDSEELEEINGDDEEPSIPKGLSKKNKMIVIAAAAVVAIIILAVLFTSMGGDDDNGSTGPNHTPNAANLGDRTVNIEEQVTFDASNSSDDDGDTLTYRWKFDDGVILAGEIVHRYFNVTGVFECTLTVDDGKAIDTVVFDITAISTGPSNPPAITLTVTGIPPTPLTTTVYVVTVTASEPDEEIANFTFEIVKSENDGVMLKGEVSDISATQGNVTFIDLGRQTIMDEGDSFEITTDQASLPAVDGDKFKLYYKGSSGEVLVAEAEFETIGS
jgi:hypothetical protein